MARIVGALISVAAFGVALGACAPKQPEFAFRTPPSAKALTCDTATAHVLTFGRSTGKLYADIALKNQITDLRGYMFNSGLRRIQLVQQTNDCTPAFTGGMASSLYRCTARAQMCGT